LVESSAPTLGHNFWVIPEEPVLQIGEVDGQDTYLFMRIPLRLQAGMGGIMRLDDGRFVVADRGGQRVRFFDPEGKFVSQFGGEGGGPGEFPSKLTWMTLVGERIPVAVRGRISYFDLEGDYLDGVDQTTPGFSATNGIFPDKPLLTRILDPSLNPITEGMVELRQGRVVVVGPDGRQSDWSAVVNTGTYAPMEWNGTTRLAARPFGPTTVLFVADYEWVYGWGSEYLSKSMTGVAACTGSAGALGSRWPCPAQTELRLFGVVAWQRTTIRRLIMGLWTRQGTSGCSVPSRTSNGMYSILTAHG
ncbi:MAG: hypothetical protein KJN92_08915, partial [Gemmatimonadetes bacterium]|nr:hypothetical protein [Gemmatimonadota bacterium]